MHFRDKCGGSCVHNPCNVYCIPCIDTHSLHKWEIAFKQKTKTNGLRTKLEISACEHTNIIFKETQN